MLSTCPSIRPSVCYQSAEHDIVKTKEPIVLQIGTSGPRGRGGGGTVNFWGQEVKVQGQMTQKLDPVTWRRRHSFLAPFDGFGFLFSWTQKAQNIFVVSKAQRTAETRLN